MLGELAILPVALGRVAHDAGQDLLRCRSVLHRALESFLCRELRYLLRVLSPEFFERLAGIF